MIIMEALCRKIVPAERFLFFAISLALMQLV